MLSISLPSSAVVRLHCEGAVLGISLPSRAMGRATVTVLPMRRSTRWSLLLLTTSLPFSAIEPPGFSPLQPFPIILENSATPQRHQIETMPGGVAILDFDNDGRPDVFFTNGATHPGLTRVMAERRERALGLPPALKA